EAHKTRSAPTRLAHPSKKRRPPRAPTGAALSHARAHRPSLLLQRLPRALALALCGVGASPTLVAAAPAQADAGRHAAAMAPEQLLNLAADARRDSDWPRALEFYGQLLAQHPGHPTAVRERALTLQQQGAVVEAWRQYRERPTLFKPGEALGF